MNIVQRQYWIYTLFVQRSIETVFYSQIFADVISNTSVHNEMKFSENLICYAEIYIHVLVIKTLVFINCLTKNAHKNCA